MSDPNVPFAPVAQGPSPEWPDATQRLPGPVKSQFRRYLEAGRAYLVTTNTKDRQPLFADAGLARIVLRNLRFYRDRFDFKLHAYVVMPDHLHLLLTPGRIQLPDIMRNLKSYIAKEVHEAQNGGGSTWQPRFHDRGIRDHRQFDAALKYIHLNPVKAGLARSEDEYEFSSAHAYSSDREPLLGVDLLDGSRLGP